MLEALGRDFDVSAIDPGPRDDIDSGEVWPDPIYLHQCGRCFLIGHSTEDHDARVLERNDSELAARAFNVTWPGSVQYGVQS